jgi:membrane dipeptidase
LLIWDNHACMPMRPDDPSFLPQLERVRAAGVNVVSLNAGYGPLSIELHVRMLAQIRGWVAQRSDQYVLGRTVDDVRNAEKDGRLVILFDIEGMGAIDDQLELLGLYYELGVRWIMITYNRNNLVGGGCYDDDQGLTEFGRAVIDEMNRIGMVLCCSHTGERTVLEAIDHSADPVIFSHSNPSGVFSHARNISDTLIKACAARGGVVGMNGIGPFLTNDIARSADVVRNIDYVVQLVGPDHVGIGLDFVFDQADLEQAFITQKETFPDVPDQLSFVGPEQIPEITEGLGALGYSDADLAAIMGGNWLRIAEQVWK